MSRYKDIVRKVPLVYAGACVALSALAVAGCQDGRSGTSVQKGVENSMKAIEKCLADLGAVRAVDRAEIQFFVDDLDSGDVVKPGIAGNGMIDVARYQPATVSGRPGSGRSKPDYYVWIGRPSVTASDGDPLEGFERGSSNVLVMFVRNPDRGQSRAGARCLDSLGTRSLDVSS